jgi:outer membrane protein assembly factor BamB
VPHRDAIERMARNDQQWLWMTWIRAHVLNKLGNETARDEAIVELERVLKTHTVVSPDGGVAPISPRIVFPDGVSISTARARELLSQPFQSAAPAALSDATGLMPGFKARWSWKANGSNISALRPIGKNRILIGEYSGALSCVDSISGKVLWSRDDVIPRFQPSGGERYSNPSEIVSVMGRSGFQVVPLAGSVEGGDADRFCLGGLGCVSCYSLKDGQLLWQADVGANAHKPGAKRPIPVFTQAAVNVFAIPGKPELVTWDSASSTLARIDPSSGKLLWYHVVKTASPGRTVATNSGASLHGNRLLVYGPMTAVIDITNGETVWSFEAHKLRSFPVSLQKQKKPQTNTPITPITSISPILFGGSSHIHWPAQTPQPPLIYPRPSPWQFNRQRPLTITSSAVQWAANAQRGTLSYAELQGSRVLLYQNYTVHTVELDLPLATKTNGLVGYLFGKVGRTTCTLASSVATFTNLNNASVKSHPLTDLLPVPGKVMSVPIQATTDGLLAYVTGQRGIQCINIKSGELVFQVPWPKSVAPEVVTSTVVAVAQPFGYSPSRSINLSSANPYQPPNPGAQRNPTANCSLACISNGILFTLTAADTVVALEGATVDGR